MTDLIANPAPNRASFRFHGRIAERLCEADGETRQGERLFTKDFRGAPQDWILEDRSRHQSRRDAAVGLGTHPISGPAFR